MGEETDLTLQLSDIHQQNAWRGHHDVVFKIKVLHFKLENTSIKDVNGKRKFKRMLSFFFCGQTKAFCYEIAFRGIQPCFLAAERLACFQQTKAARLV